MGLVGFIFCGVLFMWCLLVVFNFLWFIKFLVYGFNEEIIKLCVFIVVINFWYFLLVFIIIFLGVFL